MPDNPAQCIGSNAQDLPCVKDRVQVRRFQAKVFNSEFGRILSSLANRVGLRKQMPPGAIAIDKPDHLKFLLHGLGHRKVGHPPRCEPIPCASIPISSRALPIPKSNPWKKARQLGSTLSGFSRYLSNNLKKKRCEPRSKRSTYP